MKYAPISLIIIEIILLIVCHQRDRDHSILREAQKTMGGKSMIPKIHYIYTSAECTGPKGPFQTQIWSSRKGYVRFEQHSFLSTIIAGIDSSKAWMLKENEVVKIDAAYEVFLHGHELHLIALDPFSRFKVPEYFGQKLFLGRNALSLQFEDKLNNPVTLFYDAISKLPLGIEFVNPFNSGEKIIQVQFMDWQYLENGLYLFTRATFQEGEEQWSYEYKKINFNNFNDSVFVPPKND